MVYVCMFVFVVGLGVGRSADEVHGCARATRPAALACALPCLRPTMPVIVRPQQDWPQPSASSASRP
jgi:hypothetical protein